MIHHLMTELEQYSEVMPIAYEFYALAMRENHVRKALNDYYHQYLWSFEKLLKQGIKSGEFREVDANRTAVSIIALLEGLTLLWVIGVLQADIKELLGVPRANWSTFGPSYSDCPRLNEWVGGKYTLEESEIEAIFYKCLSDIRFIKSQLSEYNKYRKRLLENDIPRLKERHPGFNAPRFSLNAMIYKYINDGVYPDKKDIFFIDMYKNTYVILQMIDKNSALFYDTNGQWPSIYFLAPEGRPLKEGVALNNAADYYTFEGVYTYKNRQGFDRQAYIIRGHLDPEFRSNSMSFFYTQQWLKDKNIDGM